VSVKCKLLVAEAVPSAFKSSFCNAGATTANKTDNLKHWDTNRSSIEPTIRSLHLPSHLCYSWINFM